jgi:hypothetical protein
MIIEMLGKIEKNFSVEFMANVAAVREEISKGMSEEGVVDDDLVYVMRRALSHKKGNQEDEKMRIASIYALAIWYKYFRIGRFYVDGLFEEEIDKIPLSEEAEIQKILKLGLISDYEHVRFWSEYALMPQSDIFR